MPIIGTTTNTPIQTNRIGKVWKGAKATGQGKQKRPGKDLKNKFRLDLPEPFASAIKGQYGTLEPAEVNVFFPYDNVDQVFETWNDGFTAKGFSHRCNGERITREIVYKTAYRQGKSYKKRCAQDCDRPCHKKPDEVICSSCQSMGYLSFIVRELFGIGGMSQVVCQSVSGIYDVVGIHQQLTAFEQKYGSLRQSPVLSPATHGFIPFVLRRVEKAIHRPMMDTDGGYTDATYHAIVITEDPKWLEHWANMNRRMMVLQAAQSGQAALLMPEDQALLHEMQSISLPGFNAVEAPKLQQAPSAQPQLNAAPEFTPIDTESVAQEWAEEDGEDESVDPGIEYRDQQLAREPRERIAAVNGVLKLDLQEVIGLCSTAKESGKDVDHAIQLMIYAFGETRGMSEENSSALITKIQEQLPNVVDEDLAQIFVAESMHRSEIELGHGKPETYAGVAIE